MSLTPSPVDPDILVYGRILFMGTLSHVGQTVHRHCLVHAQDGDIALIIEPHHQAGPKIRSGLVTAWNSSSRALRVALRSDSRSPKLLAPRTIASRELLFALVRLPGAISRRPVVAGHILTHTPASWLRYLEL